MRTVLSAILGFALTATIFLNSQTAPSQSPAPAAPAGARAATISSYPENQQNTPLNPAGCKLALETGPSCANCGPHCPTADLLSAVGAFYGSSEDTKHWNVPSYARGNLEFVIAVVPDPVHTHLSLFFDRSIESILEAAQESNYIFSRATMPWNSREHPESLDFRIRLEQQEYEDREEEIPGLLIFRRHDFDTKQDGDHSLFVLVVGETPTGGIHKLQFQNSIRIIREIREGTGLGALPSPFHIFGPTFSGSLYSLMDLLVQEPLLLNNVLEVRSGTVSSWDMVNWFETYEPRPPRLSFVSFHENDRFALLRLIEYVRGLGFKPSDISLLSEGETAYGSHSPVGHTSVAQLSQDEKEIVRLYFPREISRLRSAYQRGLRGDASFGEQTELPPRPILKLNLEDTRNDDEGAPSYSRDQTPLSQEAMLLSVVDNLQKHHTRFIVLRATDALDQLFLSKFLRVAYPEGRIITVGADLLFEREVNDPHLRGILALTPYSLLPGSDDQVGVSKSFSAGSHVDRIFPASVSAGSYNAMLSLLAHMNPSWADQSRTDCGAKKATNPGGTSTQIPPADLPVAPYFAYGWPCLAGPPRQDQNTLRPPLWLTVLGQDGYWPLALLDKSPDAGATAAVASSLHAVKGPLLLACHPRHPPTHWKVLVSFCIAVTVIFLALTRKGSILAGSDVVANFSPLNDQTRNQILLVAHLVLVFTLLSLSWPLARWGTDFDPFWRWFLWIALVIVGLLILGARDFLRRGARKEAQGLILCAILAVIVSTVLARVHSEDTAQNFMIYRYIHINSGVSPLVPWLLLGAAGLWWAWYTLAGVVLFDDRQPCLPDVEDLRLKENHGTSSSRPQDSLQDLSSRSVNRLLIVIKPIRWDWRVYGPAILLCCISVVALELRHPVQSFEGWLYDLLYGYVLGFVVFVLLTSLLRLAVVWLEFRKLLIFLDRYPLRRSLDRLKGFSWEPIWRLGGTAIQDSYRLVWREFESLDHLWNLKPKDPELVKAIEAARQMRIEVADLLTANLRDDCEKAQMQTPLRRFFHKIWAGQPEWVRDWIMKFQGLQKQLAVTCAATLRCLSRHWDSETTTDIFEAPHPARAHEAKRKPQEPVEVQLMEQFVCFFYLNFILSILLRMRTLVMIAGGMLVFILLSFGSYPFEPRTSFHALMILLFLIVVGVVALVLAQMHRNATLSRITDTNPGELGLEFWIRLGSFVALPLLSLLAAQFPQIGNFLLSWLRPALQALKG